MGDLLLATWEHRVSSPGSRTILPDGCRDVILVADASGRMHVTASPLMAVPTPVSLVEGATYRGFRLVPGAQVDDRALAAFAARLAADPADVARQLPLLAGRTSQLAEALAALRAARDVRRAARACGVGTRTLQRLVAGQTGQTPVFWLRLARARSAARVVAAAGLPLADVAADHGFSDQAHLTREIRRFVGTTPGRIGADGDILAQLFGRGYDRGATGEHSSTKKPSASRT